MKKIIGRGLVNPGIQAAFLGLLVFVIYLLTLAPGLMYTDSGELSAACTTLGVAHPTGYPLFILLGHVWTLMSWGSPVAALNVLAALWVAAAVGVCFLVIRETIVWISAERTDHLHSIVAASAALMFGLSSTVWAQATSVEVYSLHLLLTAITLLFIIKSVRDNTNAQRWSVLAGLFYGLMLSNHLSSAFLAPGFVVLWLSGADAPRERLKRWPFVVVPALVGLALYAVLPLRSAQEPPINWGIVSRGLDAFLYHVKGTQFGVWLFSDKKAFSVNVALFSSILASMLLWVGIVPAVVGLWRTIDTKKRFGLGLLVLIAGNLGISFGYAIPDLEPYFLPSLLVITILFACGTVTLLGKVPRNAQWALFIVPCVVLVMEWKQQDKSEHTAVANYTEWILDNAEPNAIIMTRQWDYFCSAAWYLQTVENVRPDVTLIDKELLRRTWYAPWLLQRYPTVMGRIQDEVDAYMPHLELFESDSKTFNLNQTNVRDIQQRFVELLNAFLEKNLDRPVYITPEMLNEEPGFAQGYERRPAGPLVRLVRPNASATQRNGLGGTSALVEALAGRTERLDVSLRQTTLSSLGTMAMYRLDAFSDTVGFRTYRDLARRLDRRDRITRQLDVVMQ